MRLFSYRGLRIAVVRSPSWHLPPDRSLILRISRPPALNAMALAKLALWASVIAAAGTLPNPPTADAATPAHVQSRAKEITIGDRERPRVREPQHGRQSDRRLRHLEQHVGRDGHRHRGATPTPAPPRQRVGTTTPGARRSSTPRTSPAGRTRSGRRSATRSAPSGSSTSTSTRGSRPSTRSTPPPRRPGRPAR